MDEGALGREEAAVMARRPYLSLLVLGLAAFGVLSALLFTARAPGASAGGPALDFSIGVNTLGGSMMAADTCSSCGTPTDVCNVRAGSEFIVRSYLNGLPPELSAGYEGQETILQYNGVTLNTNLPLKERVDVFVWPPCDLPGILERGDIVGAACVTSDGPQMYLGPVAEVHFLCTASGTVTMKHGNGNTGASDSTGGYFEPGGDESLTVNCLSPQAYPVDTDGDGCPDMKEEGMMVSLGGMRDFLNPWDYFNPTHDGKNRVDDILQTVYQFFIDQGNPYYTQDTDRTLIGPMLWNLGPPDGTQRSQDILLANKQFFHDCS